MGLSAAERQRRSRAHRRGEHDLCDPARCEHVTPPVTAVTDPDPAAGVTDDVTAPLFGPTGTRLWEQLVHDEAAAPPRPERTALLVELCRAVDRAQVLDALARGDVTTWAQLRRDNGGELVLRIDSVVAEARAHAGLIRGLVEALAPAGALAAAPAGALGAAQPPTGPQTGGMGVVDLAAAVASRRTGAAGTGARAG